MLATATIYLDRQVLALTADKIIGDFHLTKEGFGRIIATFRYSYGLAQIFGGFFVDAMGPGIVFPVASGLWALSGLMTGFAGTVRFLTVCRTGLGVGEAFNWPCALKITNDLVPPRDRPLANGIFNSGSAIGALVAPIIVTVITISYSWRAAFVFTGAVGALWVIVWTWYVRRERQQPRGVPFAAGRMFNAALHIVSHRMFWVLLVAAIIINSVSYYLADWVPLYLKLSRGFSFAVGNILSMFIYAGSSIGNLLVGVLVRSLASRGIETTTAKRLALVACSCLMFSSILAGLIRYRYLTVALLAITSMGVAGFLVIYQTLLQDIEPGYVGITSGLLGGIGNLAYGFLSPYIGRLADLHKSFITLILVGLLPWLACVVVLCGLKSDNHVTWPPGPTPTKV
jgi:MFS transporter, ACS family, hexuronate transporter